jgi:hypothetical protein
VHTTKIRNAWPLLHLCRYTYLHMYASNI